MPNEEVKFRNQKAHKEVKLISEAIKKQINSLIKRHQHVTFRSTKGTLSAGECKLHCIR